MSSCGSKAKTASLGEPNNKSALVVLIKQDAPESLYTAIQDIRRVGDKHFSRWPPHITIAFPFAPDEDLEAAANVLYDALAEVEPFELAFDRLGYFQHGPKSHTIWLAPQDPGASEEGPDPACPPPHPALRRLQAACEGALPRYNRVRAAFGQFNPHLSIKQAMWPQQVHSFIREANWSPKRYAVSEVVILRREEDTPFRPAFHIPFGRAGPLLKVDPPTTAEEPPAGTQVGSGRSEQLREAAGEGGERAYKGSRVEVDAAFDVDGSVMEGGGQILRVAIALATLLNKPLRIRSIRAKRSKPGLQPQHLTGVQLVSRLGEARLHGGEVGSVEIALEPTGVRGGHFTANPGTAGSISLLIQAALPCLPFGRKSDGTPEPSSVTLRGGTSVSHSPSIDYFTLVTAPLLRRMGIHAHTTVKRRGYFPQGGGHVELKVDPCDSIQPIELLDCGVPRLVRAVVCGIVDEGGSAHGLANALRDAIGPAVCEVWGAAVGVEGGVSMQLEAQPPKDSAPEPHSGEGPGSKRQRVRRKREVLHVLLVLETSTGCLLGADELLQDLSKAEGAPQAIAHTLLSRIKACLDTGACVDEHTIDQVILPMALAQGTSRVRGPPKRLIPSLHLETAIHMASSLSGATFSMTEADGGHEATLIQCEGIGYGATC